MIALFDEPVRVTFTGWVGRVGLLLGMVKNGDDVEGLVVLEDGSLSLVGAKHITVDWRYDVEKDRWISTDATITDQG